MLGVLWFVITFRFALGYENAAIDRYYLVPLLIAVIWRRWHWTRSGVPWQPPWSAAPTRRRP